MIRRLYIKLLIAIRNSNRRSIMTVEYNPTTNYIECVDWVSATIREFSGTFTKRKWALIKRFCNLSNEFPFTRIYIWKDMREKHLAYGEPIHNYIKDTSLLQTGQGFHYGSGKKHYSTGTASELKEWSRCPTCKQLMLK